MGLQRWALAIYARGMTPDADPAPVSDLTPPAETPPAVPVTPPVASTSGPGIDPAAAFAALGNPLRWAIYQMLARGEALTASQAAGRLKRDFDGVSKHLRVMRSAGVVASRRSEEDGRLELYYIPTALRRADGVVDLGFCAIRVPGSV